MKLKLSLILQIIFQFANSQVKKQIKMNGYQIFYNYNLRLDETGRNGIEFYLLTQKENVNDNFAENLNLKAAEGKFDKIIDFDNKIDELATIL